MVQPGQKVSKQLVVRGKRPFKIVGVKCDDASFDIVIGDEAQLVHKLQVDFTAGDRDGKVSQQIGIETDQGATPTFTAFAQVVGSDAMPTPAKRKEKIEAAKVDSGKVEPAKLEAKKKGSGPDEVEAVLQLNVEPNPDEQ